MGGILVFLESLIFQAVALCCVFHGCIVRSLKLIVSLSLCFAQTVPCVCLTVLGMFFALRFFIMHFPNAVEQAALSQITDLRFYPSFSFTLLDSLRSSSAASARYLCAVTPK